MDYYTTSINGAVAIASFTVDCQFDGIGDEELARLRATGETITIQGPRGKVKIRFLESGMTLGQIERPALVECSGENDYDHPNQA